MKLPRLGVKGKVLAVFASMGVLLVVMIGYTVYSLSYNHAARQYTGLARSSANMAATFIDDRDIDSYLQNPDGSEYQSAYAKLQELKRAYGLTYLYVFIPDTSKNNSTYVFDIYTEENDASLIASPGDNTGEDNVYGTVLEIYLTGDSKTSSVITKTEFGYLATAYVPVFAPDGGVMAVVGADISMDTILSDVRSQTFNILSAAVAIIVLFLLLLLFFTDRRILRPIVRLSRHMGGFAESGELSVIAVPHTGDELQTISESFNRMVSDIKRYIENLAIVTADRERIAAELSVAKDIQGGMLSCVFPAFPDRPEFDLYACMNPAREVGGDFYDFFLLPGNRLCVVVADVSGKGVPAALFMVITKTLIKNQASMSESPGEILIAVNDQLCESNDAGFFVTAFLAILNLETGLLTYSNAGHNRPLICRDGGYSWLEPDPGFVLAGLPDFRFEDDSLTLRPGDRLFLYTDGVTEAQNNDEELWGDDRLIESLNQTGVPSLSPADTVARVLEDVSRFAGEAQQADDITALTLHLQAYTDSKG